MIDFHWLISPGLIAAPVVSFAIIILAYLKDSNAAAQSVDSDIFSESSDSSICALQDLTLTFIS